LARIDPRLVAILVSSVILSTLLVLTLIKPRGEQALLLLGNEYPEAIPKRPHSIGLANELSYVVMATREFEEVELRFSSLYEKDPGINVSTPVDPMEFPMIATLDERVKYLGGEVVRLETTAEVGGVEFEATIIDFSDFLEYFNDEVSLSVLPTVYVILSRDGEVKYFEGSSTFFLDAVENINYLSTARNEEKIEYFKEGQMLKEGLVISDSKRDGVLTYEDVQMDERFSVTFQIDIEEDGLRQILDWTPDAHFIELVQGYADGSRELVLLNVISRGLSDEE
jgi:hypothetical protein